MLLIVPAILLGVFLVLAGVVVPILSRRKKSGSTSLALLGSTGVVDTKLGPKGTVLIRGELWHAYSNDGRAIDSRSTVKVIGTRNHFLLVTFQDRYPSQHSRTLKRQ